MFTSRTNLSRWVFVVLLVLNFSTWTFLSALAQDQPIRTIRVTKPEHIYSVVFSPDGKKLLSAGDNGVLWDVETGERIATLPRHPYGEMFRAAFSPDGKLALTAGYISEAILWDVATGKEIHTFHSPGTKYFGPGAITGIAFSPDGKTIATGDTEGVIQLWDVETGEQIRQYSQRKSHFESGGRFTFMPDGKELLGNFGIAIGFFNVETGEGSGGIFEGDEFSLSRDGTKLLTNGLRLYDVEKRSLIRNYVINYRQAVNSVALSPDGKMVLIGGVNNAGHIFPRYIYEAGSDGELRSYTVTGEKNSPSAPDEVVEFSPDGKRFLTLNGTWEDDRQAIHIWDISDLTSGVRGMKAYDVKE